MKFYALHCFYDCDESEEEEEEEKANVEAAIVKVAERTNPVCICGKELKKYQVQYAYNGNGVRCNGCSKSCKDKHELIYHCPDGKNNYKHSNGYDLCLECGEKQLQFDELSGLLDIDKDYKLKRDERYPIRCTLQYYKATDNGVVNKEIIDDIVKQLETSQKMADNIGSLVTEYNPNRSTEWVNNNNNNEENEWKLITDKLKELSNNDWEQYLNNFKENEISDKDLTDLKDYSAEDWKELIPKMGPRNKFKKWVQSV